MSWIIHKGSDAMVLKQKSAILADSRWCGSYGIGRFATEVITALPELQRIRPGLAPHPFHKLDIPWTIAQILYHRPRLFFSLGFNPPPWSPVPVVFTLYDLILLHFPSEANPLMQPYFRYILRPAAKRAAYILTCSEFSKQEIIAWAGIAPEKVVVVGCGVDDSFTPEGDPMELGFPYLIYVGNHRPHKNLLRLLAAFQQAQRLPMDLKLLLSGTPTPDILEEIRRLGLVDRVQFTGFIQDQDLPAYYRGAVALMFPSLYEGFGLPPIEAMACGIPVLTANVTSLPEVVGDAALFVNPYDVAEIAAGIERIVNDGALRSDLITRGFHQAQKYRWSDTIEKTYEVLVSVLAQSRSEFR
jgi:glycosyltransferase involved in cell wall biosynthesis